MSNEAHVFKRQAEEKSERKNEMAKNWVSRILITGFNYWF